MSRVGLCAATLLELAVCGALLWALTQYTAWNVANIEARLEIVRRVYQ